MDLEIWVKIAGAALSIFTLYKVLIDVVLARFSKRRDEYDFTKKYLGDLDNPDTHHYVLEKGFFALTGTSLSVDEIKYLIDLDKPTQSIARRSIADRFIQFNFEIKVYEWKGIYQNNIFQKCGENLFLTGYIIACSLALIPVFVIGTDILKNLPTAAVCISLIIIAVICLLRHENFKIAQKFMSSNQVRSLTRTTSRHAQHAA